MLFRPSRALHSLFGMRIEPLLLSFDAQFEEMNGYQVYRQDGKGEAYRVSQDQYEDMRSTCIRRLRRAVGMSFLGILLGLPAIGAGSATLEVPPDSGAFLVAMAVMFALVVAPFIVALRRAYVAPAVA